MELTERYDIEQLTQEATNLARTAVKTLQGLPDVALDTCDPGRTVLIVIDMIRGFTVQGPLASARLQAKAAPIAALAVRCLQAGIPVLAFADSHAPQCPEFERYPLHCLRGSRETKLCGELDAIEGLTRINKNSTNGYLEPAFRAWQRVNEDRDTYIVVGGCTDICVRQFAVTAKAAFNAVNRPSRILLPTALCDTFEGEGHPAAYCHVTSLLSMQADGIELCGTIV